ncbi:cyclic nucleotide-binding protein [Leptospira tipperaryensis]|uniref:Cyclic nucleotide-binding protein n=1 Tax=Leptospira tipperaryensis TaxID=2564040 RepID=A0A1D7UW52_9LEPT|nr:Crp/Fnr family transcriptional regulator [Leptospira tipperaryensis]AOP33788.1 cyclic nucleotide-binding protein [Leptospira tipperaryensis]
MISDIPFIENLKKKIPSLDENWPRYKHMLEERTVPPRTVLIHKGEFVKTIFIVKKGCLRIWFDDDGRDITVAFFFENRPITSLHSYRGTNETSGFVLESVETTEFYMVSAENAALIYQENEKLKDFVLEYTLERFDTYMALFLSRIRESPEERYLNLIRQQPDIISRVPQHYIASYLGITPVSLSRIRNRVWKEHKKKLV